MYIEVTIEETVRVISWAEYEQCPQYSGFTKDVPKALYFCGDSAEGILYRCRQEIMAKKHVEQASAAIRFMRVNGLENDALGEIREELLGNACFSGDAKRIANNAFDAGLSANQLH